MKFRDARPGDEALLLRFIRALAEYEQLSHEATSTERDLTKALFTPTPRCHALIVEQDSEAIGFALWFYSFSTFAGRPNLYLEDIFVLPQHRGQGVGKAIFRELARRAVQEGCGRMEWMVLDDNVSGLRFYESIKAQPVRDWTVQRLSGDALTRLAA